MKKRNNKGQIKNGTKGKREEKKKRRKVGINEYRDERGQGNPKKTELKKQDANGQANSQFRLCDLRRTTAASN